PELNHRRFVADTLGPDSSVRLFKSGDKVRFLPGAEIEFLGRFDEQVKIRGWRIEPREIESALAGHPGVRQALVTVREDTPGDKRLTAYVVCAEANSPTAVELRAFLRQKLPEYMMPSAILKIGAIPLNPNGKVDRAALPAPVELEVKSEFLGPRDP